MLRNYNNLIALSDRIHNLKLDKLPTNIVLNQNDQYTLIVKTNKLSLTYNISISNCQITIPIVKIPYTKFNIDWGDGNLSSYIYEKNFYNIKHTYNNIENKNYTILIGGDFKGLDNSESITNLDKNYLYMIDENPSSISGAISSYTTKYYLYSINNWGNIPIQNLTNFCINASGLVKIPDAELPNVNHCMSAFMNCINLYKGFNLTSKNMENFELPINAVNCQNMFSNTNIQYDFSNINDNNYITNIAYMFYNTKITGINKTLYSDFIEYYKGSTDTINYIAKISGNYYNAFPNSISTTIGNQFNKDYFKKILSPHK